MMSNREREIDRQAEMLSRHKLEKSYDEVLEGKTKLGVARLGDFGIYECSLPLPDQKDFLKTFMTSFKTPTGEEWLEITPVEEVHLKEDEYSKEHGIDVSVEAFNSYQRARHNPDLITFRRVSDEEKQEFFKKKEAN